MTNIDVLDERTNTMGIEIKLIREELKYKVDYKWFAYIAGGVSALAISLIIFLINQQFTFQKDFSDYREAENRQINTLTGEVTQISSTLNGIVNNYSLKINP